MEIKTSIKIDGEEVFLISSNGDNSELSWTVRTLKDDRNHSRALKEIAKIAYEISKHKIDVDEKRILESKGPVTLG